MKAELQPLLEKVTKLRTLAARAGTQAEAEAAAAQADAIIAKYRLDEAELEAAGQADPESATAHADPLDTVLGRWVPWLATLATGLAAHYGCFVYRREGDGVSSLPVFGRASDVAILRLVYASARTEITRLSKRERGAVLQRGFCVGAVAGYIEALKRATQAEQKHHPDSAAMVLVSRRQEAERLARGQVHLVSARGSSRVESSAFQRGKSAGDALSMEDGIRALPRGGPRLLKE